MKRPSRNTLLIVGVGALLTASTLAVFAQAVRFDFVEYDDPKYVTRNEHVQRGLTWDSVTWAFVAFHAGHWHPLTWISHMADVEMFGDRPAGPHAVNVVLHTFNALLLFGLLVRMTGRILSGGFVAGLFALHLNSVLQSRTDAIRRRRTPITTWIRYIGGQPELIDTGLERIQNERSEAE